jgi:hypothetical protein
VRARGLAALAFALVLAVPGLAEACPYCAGRDDGGISSGIAIGVMMFLPFLVVGCAAPLIVRMIRRAHENELPPQVSAGCDDQEVGVHE